MHKNPVVAEIEQVLQCPIQEPLEQFLALELVGATTVAKAFKKKSSDITKQHMI